MLSIVIPAFNEEENLIMRLPSILDFCASNNYKVLVVNDGSTDNTKKCLESSKQNKNLKIINHKVNKGYGAALKSGLANVETTYAITIDADGQHKLDDINKLYNTIIKNNADLVIGKRPKSRGYRSFGKSLIKIIAKKLIDFKINDLNSGMKIYKTQIVKKYLKLCPDSMAFSDVIALLFLSQKHYVIEVDISIKPREKGQSKINLKTAFETIYEILNIIMLINPIKIFLPISVFFILFGILWGFPILLSNKGVSVGASMLILIGIISFLLGLIAQQISLLRKGNFLSTNHENNVD